MTRNARTLCQDCLKFSMTKKATENTPRLNFKGTPFCIECRPFWEKIETDKGRPTWKCLECRQTMPLCKDRHDAWEIDWVHTEGCDALHDPCKCVVRNKRPGIRHCSRCLSTAGKYLAKEGAKIAAQMPKRHKHRGGDKKQAGNGDPSPWGENAVRAMEGD